MYNVRQDNPQPWTDKWRKPSIALVQDIMEELDMETGFVEYRRPQRVDRNPYFIKLPDQIIVSKYTLDKGKKTEKSIPIYFVYEGDSIFSFHTNPEHAPDGSLLSESDKDELKDFFSKLSKIYENYRAPVIDLMTYKSTFDNYRANSRLSDIIEEVIPGYHVKVTDSYQDIESYEKEAEILSKDEYSSTLPIEETSYQYENIIAESQIGTDSGYETIGLLDFGKLLSSNRNLDTGNDFKLIAAKKKFIEADEHVEKNFERWEGQEDLDRAEEWGSLREKLNLSFFKGISDKDFEEFYSIANKSLGK